MLTLEGEQFPITGGVMGDGPGNSFVYIPSLKAVVAGDTVFDHVYFGVPKDKAREDWMKTLDQISALQPGEAIVPGHQGPGATQNAASIEWMKKYIADWDANVASSKNSRRDAGEGCETVSPAWGWNTRSTIASRRRFFPAK